MSRHRPHSTVAIPPKPPSFRFRNGLGAVLVILMLAISHAACSHRAQEPDAQGSSQGEMTAPGQVATHEAAATTTAERTAPESSGHDPLDTMPLAGAGDGAAAGEMAEHFGKGLSPTAAAVEAAEGEHADATALQSTSGGSTETPRDEPGSEGSEAMHALHMPAEPAAVLARAAESAAPASLEPRPASASGRSPAVCQARDSESHAGIASTGASSAPDRTTASPPLSPVDSGAALHTEDATARVPDAAAALTLGSTTPAMAGTVAPLQAPEASEPAPAAQAGVAANAVVMAGQQGSAVSGVPMGWLGLAALLAILLLLLLLALLRRRRRKRTSVVDGGSETRGGEIPGVEDGRSLSPQLSAADEPGEPKAGALGAPAGIYTLSTRPRPQVVRRASAQVVPLPSRRGRAELEMSDTPVVQVMPQAAPAEPVSSAPTPATVQVDANECVAEAKRRLTANQPKEALQALEPVLAQPQAPAEAWVVAGWAHWRIANEVACEAPMDAATSAARAFEQALRLEPKRGDLLTRLARCHLLRAAHASGTSSRIQCLEQALAQFERRSQLRNDQPADRLEVAQVLMQRAQLAPQEDRAKWLAQAEGLMSEIPEHHPVLEDVDARRACIDLQLALAGQREGAETSRLYSQAITALGEEVARADTGSRDAWLLKLIDAAREWNQRMQGAGRLLQLQAIKTQVAPYLARTEAVAPLLSWINLLDDWAGLLHARAAQAKLAEADSLFERVALLPAQGQAGIQFARAYYLRLRARYEHGAAQLRTLEQALERLDEIPANTLPATLLQLERAEIQLRMGRHLGIDAGESHIRASAYAALGAADESANPEPAWVCAAFALGDLAKAQRLSAQEQQELRELCQHLEKIEPVTPDALRAAALIRLLDGDFAASSALCERAWRNGAGHLDILPLWREADQRWAEAAPESSRDPHWRQLHQRMRLASSSH